MRNAIFVIFLSALFSLTGIKAFAHTPGGHNGAVKMRLLPVTASASLSTEPDKATLSGGVITEHKDAKMAATLNAEKMQAIYSALMNLGLDKKDIKTSRLMLRPKYNYDNKRKPRIIGYEVHNTVTIESHDLKKLGSIIDALVTAGANNINTVQFSLRDPDSVEAIVLDMAIKKAREKARIMANSAGVSLGPLQSLTTEGNSHSPFNRNYDEVIVTATSKEGSGAATPVSYGDYTVKAVVKLVYEMR